MFKKKLVTYLLWLFGGIFGLHHIYLGRYKQAFIWYGTFGGFLIGCIADLTRMSDYLDYANSNDEYFASLLKRMNRLKTPSFFSVYRIFGAIFAGSFFGYVLQYSLPLDYADIYPHVYNIFYYLAPFACSIGVYLVSTESFTKCNFFWPLIGSYIGAIPHYYQHPKAMIFCAITSTIFTNWKLEWDNKKIIDSKDKKTKPKKSKFSKELFILIICASLYTCVAASFFIHNATVTVEGETVTVKEGIINFFNSKLYQDLKASVVRLWYIYKMYGFQKLKDEFLFGESHKLARAYSTLGMSDSSSQKELDAKCRELSRKWHPDRFKDPEEKESAQAKFMDIQEACNRVSSHRQEKFDKNKQPNSEDSTASRND